MDWSTLITLVVIGLMFFLMMRQGGGCCGGGHSRVQNIRQDPSNKVEARPEREQSGRK
jgi:hypothetical protein